MNNSSSIESDKNTEQTAAPKTREKGKYRESCITEAESRKLPEEPVMGQENLNFMHKFL